MQKEGQNVHGEKWKKKFSGNNNKKNPNNAGKGICLYPKLMLGLHQY